jgi:hypothetical protein
MVIIQKIRLHQAIQRDLIRLEADGKFTVLADVITGKISQFPRSKKKEKIPKYKKNLNETQ